jgi:hypothetical protein
MNHSDRQLGRIYFALIDAVGKSVIDPEDRAVWEMLDATMAHESAANQFKQDQTLLQQHWLRCTELQSSHECHQL